MSVHISDRYIKLFEDEAVRIDKITWDIESKEKGSLTITRKEADELFSSKVAHPPVEKGIWDVNDSNVAKLKMSTFSAIELIIAGYLTPEDFSKADVKYNVIRIPRSETRPPCEILREAVFPFAVVDTKGNLY